MFEFCIGVWGDIAADGDAGVDFGAFSDEGAWEEDGIAADFCVFADNGAEFRQSRVKAFSIRELDEDKLSV